MLSQNFSSSEFEIFYFFFSNPSQVIASPLGRGNLNRAPHPTPAEVVLLAGDVLGHGLEVSPVEVAHRAEMAEHQRLGLRLLRRVAQHEAVGQGAFVLGAAAELDAVFEETASSATRVRTRARRSNRTGAT